MLILEGVLVDDGVPDVEVVLVGDGVPVGEKVLDVDNN